MDCPAGPPGVPDRKQRLRRSDQRRRARERRPLVRLRRHDHRAGDRVRVQRPAVPPRREGPGAGFPWRRDDPGRHRIPPRAADRHHRRRSCRGRQPHGERARRSCSGGVFPAALPAGGKLMSDSLILAITVEILGGGVPSVNPLCPGATFRMQPGFDLGAPQPTTDFVASLILDGERPFGRRASNRLIKLPVWITAPNRQILAAAREVLEQAIDQDVWTMTWTRDPLGGTPLPLIIDCFRAQATVPTYNTLFEREICGLQVTLTIPALPYGRSDVQTQVSFAAPVPTTPPPPPPPVPVVLDNFSQISSSQCSQSSQCTVGPWTCCWDPDAFGDAGGQQTPLTYSATFAAPLNLSAMQSLQMWLGFGSRYYAYLEYHGKIHGVQVFVTLTDDDGVTLGMSLSNLKLPVSPVAQQPVFSRVTMRIPQNAPVFDYGHVASYSVEIINRHDQIGRLSWVTAYLDALTASPGAGTVQPVVRGALHTLYGLAGTARSPRVPVLPAGTRCRYA